MWAAEGAGGGVAADGVATARAAGCCEVGGAVLILASDCCFLSKRAAASGSTWPRPRRVRLAGESSERLPGDAAAEGCTDNVGAGPPPLGTKVGVDALSEAMVFNVRSGADYVN